MKKILLLPFLLFTLLLSAQQQEQCATMTLLNQQMQDQNIANQINITRAAAARWRQNHPEEVRSSAPILTIPVVVHVLYKTPAQNISDPQIYSQIDILNHDYTRTNADTVNTPSVFDTIAANI